MTRKHERIQINNNSAHTHAQEWWSVCLCGWVSPILGSRDRAIVAHRLHVREKQSQVIRYREQGAYVYRERT